MVSRRIEPGPFAEVQVSRQGQNLARCSGYSTVGDLPQFRGAGYQVSNLVEIKDQIHLIKIECLNLKHYFIKKLTSFQIMFSLIY